MKTPSVFSIGLLVFILALSLAPAYSQKKQPKPYRKDVTVCFSDGVPVVFSYKGIALRFFKLVDLTHKNDQISHKIRSSDSTINVNCFISGDFMLKYKGTEVAKFNVRITDSTTTGTLSNKIKLPFNYVIKAKAGCRIDIFTLAGQKIFSNTTDKDGYIFLKQQPDYFSDKVAVCYYQDNFPKVQVFNIKKQGQKHTENERINYFYTPVPFNGKKPYYGLNNIASNVYFSVENIGRDGNLSLWLKGFNRKNQKGWVTKIKTPANYQYTDMYLDENGKPILVLSHKNPKTGKSITHCYNLFSDGHLTENSKEIYPYYLFHGKYFYGDQWMVPSFEGIPLGAGEHTIQIHCTGDKADYAAQLEAWVKAHAGKPSSKTNTFKPVSHPMEKIATLHLSVSFDRSRKNLWRIEGLENYNKVLDPDKSPVFDGMTVQRCAYYVDGNGPLFAPTSFNDINYPTELSFNLVGNAISLLSQKEDRTFEPKNILNRTEGPFPELRFSFRQVSGKYKSYDEAKNHCQKPKMRGSHKFLCYKMKTVNLCPDNYSFIVEDSVTHMDTGTLYCGKAPDTLSAYPAAGNPIAITVYAKGYRTKTLTLDKTNLELSDIHLSGSITDDKGKVVKNARIKINGFNSSFVTGPDGKYRLNAKAQGKHPLSKTLNIQLEPLQVEVSNETLGTYDPGKNFGVVSDGFTTLKLHVKTSGIDPSTLAVQPPSLGGFVPQTASKLPLVPDKNGEGDMEYVPPAYLKSAFLNKHLAIRDKDKGAHGLSGDLWAAEVPITLTYEDKDGNPGSFTFNILVCRPPVMLVHGFTGDETTWEHLAVQLRHDKYDAIVREYYKGPVDESTIERQSQKLGSYIHELREAYLHNGILQNRVDIVAHSMGGLISRYYISNMAKYGKGAGIWIPYNVKLSRQQLAQQRFQKPVVLNDVRKLIMVGTPNHGASKIDEKIGALQALAFKVHEVANEQLRYDSPFLAKLNAGESEGRHLDPNVQYALIYGKRRRAVLYPFDAVLHPLDTKNRRPVNDDGVVTVQSAMLNGVMSYVFPPLDAIDPPGYIHSPILGNICKGDNPITTDPLIFDKIEELLQEDIARVPLQHSVSRIIRADGQVFMRYYSTQNWIPVRTPLSFGNPKKLAFNFCRLKTEEGSAVLGFFLNGHHWGSLAVQPHSIVYYDFASPEYVRVYLQQGKARFRSRKQTGGGFEVVMGNQTGEKWYAFNPKARVKDLNTDFIVEEDSVLNVHSLSGKVVLALSPSKNQKPESKTIDTKKGYTLSTNGTLTETPLPDSGWWSNVDTVFVPDFIYDTDRFLLPENTVGISFSEPYLPVSGFSTLKIHVDSLPGDSLRKSYSVRVSLANDSLLPFITITNPRGTTDSLGNFKTEITFREPAPGDYASLGALPLQALFHIRMYQHDQDTLVFKQDTLIPLGMTLISGTTTGPDLHPRQEPPPQLNQVIYQLAAESDSSGHFYVLFNTTSYNKNRMQLKKLAGKTKQSVPHQMEHFLLQWPASGMFPLTWQLDSLKKYFLPGHALHTGKNGQIDMLSPPEQENRLKEMVRSFVDKMALTDSAKNLLFNKLDNLSFRYQANVQKPVWLYGENVMAIPGSNRSFWNLDKENRFPAYAALLQAMGHFLEQSIEKPPRHYGFLDSNKEQPRSPAQFDRQAYRNFHHAGATFFRYLLEHFLNNTGNAITTRSLYYQNADTTAFNKETLFLLRYYGALCAKDPAKVYSDFLFTGMLYGKETGQGEPALTLREWLLAKKASGAKAYIVKSTDPLPLAGKSGILPEKWNPVLIPVADMAGSRIQRGGKTVQDFRQIPALPLLDTSETIIVSGRFLLQFPALGPARVVELQPGARFKTDKEGRLTLISGNFLFRAPVACKTLQASVIPNSNSFTVAIDPKHTVLNVYQGEVQVKNEKDDRVVHQGETTAINKGGSIKKPRPMKEIHPPKARAVTALPFVFQQTGD